MLTWHRWLRVGAPYVLSLMRIVTALVLLEHGTQKMFDFPPMQVFGPPGGFAQAAPLTATNGVASPNSGAAAVAAARGAPAAGGAPVNAGQAVGQGPGSGGAPGAGQAGPGSRPGAGAVRAPGGGFGGPPQFLFPIAGWIETVAGGLLVVGLFSRSAAFLLSGETAVVYFIAHAPMGFYPIANGGEAAVLFA